MLKPLATALLLLLAAIAIAPLPPTLLQPPPQSLELTDRHGTLLREILDGDGRYARPAALAEISPHLIRATLAAEDRRFYHHPGVDPAAIARAAWDAIRRGRVVSGGSTITQQLVKITSEGSRRRTPWNKLVESIAAIKLDALWTKDRILEAYLNRVNYGNMRLGCAAAARFYFDKPVADLSVAEAAQLAALPRSPSRLNPLRHPSAARDAQQLVLGRMLRDRWLSFAEYLAALDERIDPGARRVVFRAPHFADLALAGAGARAGLAATTLDLGLNGFVEECLRARLAALADKRVSNGAAVIIDNRTGELLALVGSENYFRPDCGQVNAATARRSSGSTLKPFTYLLALQRGHTPASVLADVPSEFPTPTGMFRPINFDQSFRGPVRLRTALANSLNVPAVRLLSAIGGPAPLADALHACGITTLDSAPEHYGLGLTVGNAEVRLIELANAYACLARLGIYRPLRIFRDETAPSPPDERRVFDPDAAWLIADILNDDFARAPAFGPRSGLDTGFDVACKTGTSSDFRDNWAFGYTPEFTVGTWIGNFDGSPMLNVSGVTGAAPLLRDIFRHLHRTRGTGWYPRPVRIIDAKIHPITGKRSAPRQPGTTERFIAGHLPPAETPADYDADGRPILGTEFAAWLAAAQPTGLAPATPDSPAILS
ncbi:MAG: penicillin-binding protein 1C, partial [Verrucomicrobiae bacterium]|nr:penicillin-binding protein 1C [Verrucomicrobiae bacterium]